MDDFFETALRTTEELDFDGPLAAAGLELVAPPAMPGPGGPGPGSPMPGGPMPGPGGPGGPMLPPLTTGIRTKEEAGKSLVGTVVVGGPGHRAGINAGDELVALDGIRVNARDIQARIMEREPGDVVQVTVFRRDELLTLPVTLERAPPIRPVLRRVQEPTALQTEIFRSWLGIREGEGAGAPGGPAGG
jgi:predicted metalloprotease with PDZ domain